MADEILVRDQLSAEMIAGGEEMTERLLAAGWSVSAAFWLFFSDSLRWNLVFGIDEVLERGSLEIYDAIHTDFDARPLHGIDFSEIVVLQPDHPLVKQMRGFAETSRVNAPHLRVKQVVMGNVFIDDALIYFMPERRRDAA